jgi:hypothetical protein
LNGGAGGLAPNPAGPYWDLAVINAVGTPPALNPDDTILTALTGPNGENYNDGTNIAANPAFANSYLNVLRSATVIDEGGNSINVLFTPLDPAAGNYHITAVSPAVDQGTATGAPATDYDGEARPSGAGFDIGADEMNTGTVPPSPVSGIGVFASGSWYIDSNNNGTWNPGVDALATFGTAGDMPVTGDWSGAGVSRFGTYNGGLWNIDYNGNGVFDGAPADRTYYFGFGGAIPVSGDWNGSGTFKIGVYDPTTMLWFLDANGNGVWDGSPADQSSYFGIPGALPVVGDWSGSGVTRIGMYDPSTALWYLDVNGNGVWDGPPADQLLFFGIPGALPVAGDWSGSGASRIGMYDPAAALWYLDYNGNGTWDGTPADRIYNFGFGGAIAVTGNW